MNHYFTIWLQEDHVLWTDLTLDNAPDWQTGTLSQAATAAPSSANILVLIPGIDVTMTEASVPSRNRNLAAQAVPYALEESVIDDVTKLHFALATVKANQPFSVSIIQQQLLEKYLQQLQAAAISPRWLLADHVCLSVAEHWCLVEVSSVYSILRLNVKQSMAIYNAQLPLILPLLIDEAEQKPTHIDVFSESLEIDLGNDDILVRYHDSPNPTTLLRLPNQINEYNLLQGQYAPVQESQGWQRWRSVAAMLALFIGLQTAILGWENRQLNQQKQALQQQIETLYRKTFPKARKIVNARVQMEQRLNQQQLPTNQDSFMSLLAKTGKVLQKTPGFKLQQMNYRNKALDIRLQVGNVQALERLKQNLSALPLSVKLQSAATRGSQVEGRLIIEDAS